MTRYDRRYWALAASLSALAGYVDAIGFLKLGGLFVSFMSGNSTRFAVGMVAQSTVAAVAGSLIGSFLLGVIAGALISAWSGTARKPAVLLMVSYLLSFSAMLDAITIGPWSSLVMAAAMGSANCVFQRQGEVSIGVTYMTGTLVKLGQRLAGTILGYERFGWIPYLLLWIGLVAGAFIGANLYPRVGTACLWAAAVAAGLLAVCAHALGPAEPLSVKQPLN